MASGLGGKFHGIPVPVLIVGGAALAAGIYFERKKSAAATAAATPAAAAPVTAAASGTGAGGAASTAATSALAQQANQNNSNLVQSILAMQGASATPSASTYAIPTGQTLSGSGYYVPGSSAPITGSDGSQYVWISTPTQWTAITSSGGTAYYQPLPGVFMPVTSASQLAGGGSPNGPTPLFYKIIQGTATPTSASLATAAA